MNASPCDDLDEYLDETLGELRRQEFEAHLPACLDCQREVQLQRKIDSVLATAVHKEPIPQSLVYRVERRMGETSRRRRAWAIGIATAAMLVLAVGGWLGWRQTQEHGPAPVVNKYGGDDHRTRHVDVPHREETKSKPVAEVTVGPKSDGIVVPLKSDQERVAIFWIYPSSSASANSCRINESTFHNVVAKLPTAPLD